MAFDAKQFHNLAGGHISGGHRTFTYVSTADTLAQIAAVDYFLPVIDKISAKDWIFVHGSDGGGLTYVNANDGTTIDCADVLTVTGDAG